MSLSSWSVRLLLLAGCGCVSTDRTTQITIALASETLVPSELDRLSIRITDARGSLTYSNEYDVIEPSFFPTTLALVPAGEESFDGPLRIELVGTGANGAVRLQRSAVLAYARGRNLLLPMPLRMACVNFRSCGADQTCRGGQCVDATVEDRELSDFDEDQVFPASGVACFDEASCLADAHEVPVASDCTLDVPTGGNVGLVWAAAPSRVLVLQAEDAQEGWTRLPSGKGLLSHGACASLLDPETDPALREVPDRALAAYTSAACAPKAALQPFCRAADGHSGVGADRGEPL
jgi:hypothetical protein